VLRVKASGKGGLFLLQGLSNDHEARRARIPPNSPISANQVFDRIFVTHSTAIHAPESRNTSGRSMPRSNAERQRDYRSRQKGNGPPPLRPGRPRKCSYDLWLSGTWSHMSNRQRAIHLSQERRAREIRLEVEKSTQGSPSTGGQLHASGVKEK
jgi:hypothetical protein